MTECVICQRTADRSTIVFENADWIVRHSLETNIVGYVLIEARRHFLDLSEATSQEIASYGEVLSTAMTAVRGVTQCERVYTFSLAEAVPHYHLHVIPRRASFPRAYKGRGIMQYPVTPSVEPAVMELTCEQLRRAAKAAARR